MQQKTFQWRTIPTRQFKEIISTLEDAKNKSTTAMIIAATGVGKSKSVDTFCTKKSEHTYRITVSDLYKKEDILDELSEQLGITNKTLTGMRIYARSVKIRLDKIAAALIQIKNDGGKPIVIFDEAENMKITPLKMIKALYDAVKGSCSIVLIGTDQLLNKIYINKWKRNRDSVPQLYRRFKAGMKVITPINKDVDYSSFFKEYNIPVGLQKLLITLCDNYGDFQDYLEPALTEALEAGKPLTEDFFRIKYNLPKLTKNAA